MNQLEHARQILSELMVDRPALSPPEEKQLLERACCELEKASGVCGGLEDVQALLVHTLRIRMRNLLALRAMGPHDYQRLRQRLLLRANAQLRNINRAEEVVQDTFLHMITRQETYRGDAAYSTWVYSILFHRLMNQRRSREVSLDSLADRAGGELDSANLLHHLLEGPDNPTPRVSEEDSLISRDKLSKIFALLPVILTDRYSYRALNLVFLQGLSYEEAAEALGITRDHLYKVMSVARKTLLNSDRVRDILEEGQ